MLPVKRNEQYLRWIHRRCGDVSAHFFLIYAASVIIPTVCRRFTERRALQYLRVLQARLGCSWLSQGHLVSTTKPRGGASSVRVSYAQQILKSDIMIQMCALKQLPNIEEESRKWRQGAGVFVWRPTASQILDISADAGQRSSSVSKTEHIHLVLKSLTDDCVGGDVKAAGGFLHLFSHKIMMIKGKVQIKTVTAKRSGGVCHEKTPGESEEQTQI